MKRSNRRIKRVFLYPCHRIIDKFPLPHQSDSRIADLRHPDRVLFFKIRPNLLKIFAIHEQGFVGLLHPFPVFPNGAVLDTHILSRIFCPHIRQVHGCVFVISRSEQKHLAIELSPKISDKSWFCVRYSAFFPHAQMERAG